MKKLKVAKVLLLIIIIASAVLAGSFYISTLSAISSKNEAQANTFSTLMFVFIALVIGCGIARAIVCNRLRAYCPSCGTKMVGTPDAEWQIESYNDRMTSFVCLIKVECPHCGAIIFFRKKFRADGPDDLERVINIWFERLYS